MFIIVWKKTRKYADINDWHEPNIYPTFDSAKRAMETWLWPYESGYFDIVPLQAESVK